MEEDQVAESLAAARALITEEADRSRPTSSSTPDPAVKSSGLQGMDLHALKRKFPFLLEYSDTFIKETGVHILIKAETASRKLIELDRSKKAEDKLLSNRDALTETSTQVKAGEDNRLDRLHTARCLPGATCSAGKLWLHARQVIGDRGHPPLSTYDMAAIGLGGCVSAKGWVELHNPASASLSISMFSMGSCVGRSAKATQDEEFPELTDLSEFKAAIRVLRGAMSYVHPWNRSIDALEGFLVQSNYGSAELAGVDKSASFLAQFTDYVLTENTSRWRGLEVFLSTRDLHGTWQDYVSQKSDTIAASKRSGTGKPSQQKQPSRSDSHDKMAHMDRSLFWGDICVMWNMGRCPRPPGACTTRKGAPLRHVCNWRPDMSKPEVFCGKDHPRFQFHK